MEDSPLREHGKLELDLKLDLKLELKTISLPPPPLVRGRATRSTPT
jgi:hypothetical protein